MEPVGVWEWFWLMLLFAIPIVNLIAIIVIARGKGNPNVVNYCRALLLWFLVGIILALLYGGIVSIFAN